MLYLMRKGKSVYTHPIVSLNRNVKEQDEKLHRLEERLLTVASVSRLDRLQSFLY